jgi:hypothetical protein
VKVVIDASVAVKWLVIEDRHLVARDVLRDGFALIAPDLLLIEVANALRKKVRAALADLAQAKAAIVVLPRYFDRLFQPGETLSQAFDIACQINHPVADCVYLACARESGAALLTDDATLHQKAKALGADVKVILLTDWVVGTS